MFYSSMHKRASSVRKAVHMPKLLNRRKSRPLLEQLENRLCMATGAYTYSVVAATGNTVNAPGGGHVGPLTNISQASINDSGNVAFLGTVNGQNGVDEATFSNGSWTLAKLNSTQGNSTFPQIDNSGDVIAQDHYFDPNTDSIITNIRLWHPDGTSTLEGQKSSSTGDTLVTPIISSDGTQYAYQDSNPPLLLLYRNGTCCIAFPQGSVNELPMIANNGGLVFRIGSTATSPIMLFVPGQASVTIADPAFFSNIGNNPGIDGPGGVVTFTATLSNAASAASLNAANATSISNAQALAPGYSLHVNQLTPGPGVFASVPIDIPSSGPADRVVIRLAGVSGFGFLNPGETWTGTTDVGPFSAFPDARSVPKSNLTFSGPSNVLTSGSIKVVFMANDTTSSANQGLYLIDITIRSGIAAVDNPIEVVNSGETITGVGQITAVNDYFPINASGQVVFVANTAGGQAVVQANPYTYRPPSVTNPLLYNAYKPSQIRTAYGIDQIPMFTSPSGQQVTPDGTGQTIAIVGSFNDPTIISDLTKFDSAMGLPAPPSFQVYNQDGTNITSLIGTSGQNGVPQVDPTGGWEGEEALDVEWAHAIAPGASIILVEANSFSTASVAAWDAAVTWAASPASGASVVSLSLGVPEYSSETTEDTSAYMPRTGVTILAATGDTGAPGVYPAFSPNVVAVGGTTLYLNSDNSYLSETAWDKGGGAVSQFESQPTYQNGIVTPFSATQRVTPDVSFVADQRTGVLIYNSYNKPPPNSPWAVVGGTSLSTPCWAGLIAIANQGRVLLGKAPLSGATETLPALYSLPAADFHDVTTGNNGQYQLTTTNQALFSAGPGYDPATGLGSPVANLLVPGLINYSANKTITTTALTSSPNPSVFGQSVTFTATVSDTSGGSGTATGSVQFFVDGAAFDAPVTLAGGTASIDDVDDLSVGSHSITAAYTPDTTDFQSSTSQPATQVVHPAATSTTIDSGPSPSVYGQEVTFGAQVLNASAPQSTAEPTGTVQFYVDGAAYGSPVTLSDEGAALITDAELPVGSHQITASYAPDDGNFEPSSSATAATQVVHPAATSTTIDSGPSPSVHGQEVTFGAQVLNASAPQSTAEPTGTMQFYVDGAPYGSPVVLSNDGAALITDSNLAVGSHQITAAYIPDNANFAASTSTNAATQVVNPLATVLKVTALGPVTPNPRNNPVSTASVTFNEPIKLGTSNYSALTLTDNGGPNLITSAVTISLVSGSTYQINGLSGLTAINGEYTLTVNAASIQDLHGNPGSGSLSTMWLMDVSPPTSTVNPLPTRETSLTFPVSVTGSDQGNPAAGVAFYTIYVSTNSGPWTEWTTLPAPNTTANFTGQSNTSYSFYSIATDYASNVENKAAGTEASTYVPNLTPPVTSVDGTTGSNPSTLNSSTGTFTLDLTGNDPGGSALQYFEVYASVDGGSPQEVGPYAIPAGPADSSGNYHSMIIYQGLTDGQSHTYSFYSIGLDSAGNLQSAPSSPNVTFSNEVFTTPSQLQITGFTVEHDSPSRSFVRYLDLTFNESDSQSGGELTSIVNSISTTSPDIQVFKYNLDGSGSGTPVPLNSSPTILDVLDHAIEIDFGSGGILGTPNTTAADGYYKVVINLPGQQPATHYFDRILGDVNGDGIVDSNDLNEIAASIGETSQMGWTPLSADVTGAGSVTAFDLTLATRAKGHKLGSGLQLG